MTQEELVIDLWVESLLINFFLNIPSQLYTTFRKIRSKEKVIYQNNLDSHKDFIKVDFSGEHPNRQDNWYFITSQLIIHLLLWPY